MDLMRISAAEIRKMIEIFKKYPRITDWRIMLGLLHGGMYSNWNSAIYKLVSDLASDTMWDYYNNWFGELLATAVVDLIVHIKLTGSPKDYSDELTLLEQIRELDRAIGSEVIYKKTGGSHSIKDTEKVLKSEEILNSLPSDRAQWVEFFLVRRNYLLEKFLALAGRDDYPEDIKTILKTIKELPPDQNEQSILMRNTLFGHGNGIFMETDLCHHLVVWLKDPDLKKIFFKEFAILNKIHGLYGILYLLIGYYYSPDSYTCGQGWDGIPGKEIRETCQHIGIDVDDNLYRPVKKKKGRKCGALNDADQIFINALDLIDELFQELKKI